MDLASGYFWVCRAGGPPDAAERSGLIVMPEGVREMDTVARLAGFRFIHRVNTDAGHDALHLPPCLRYRLRGQVSK